MLRVCPALSLFMLVGCAANPAAYPSLEVRAGEAIDPRVPVERPLNDRPARPALVNRLGTLLAQARSGDAAFQPAIAEASARAAAAGPAQSESWIVAQQALSAAIEARAPTARALGDVDAIGAELLLANGGIAPSDLEAIAAAGRSIAAIDRRQSEAIAAVQSRLGG